MHLCRIHHSESHNIGWKRFSDKYSVVKDALLERGWYFENLFGVWKIVRGHLTLRTKNNIR